jgi:hypothetical protein
MKRWTDPFTNLPPYLYYVEAKKCRTNYLVHYGQNADMAYRYINVFAYACRHEATHGMDFDGWWPTGWISTNDVDIPVPDSIPSSVETTNGFGFNFNLTATYPQPQGVAPWDDDQDYTMRHEPCWSDEDVEMANKEDWAHPGAQYP